MSQILKMFGGEKRDKSYKKSAVIDMHVGKIYLHFVAACRGVVSSYEKYY